MWVIELPKGSNVKSKTGVLLKPYMLFDAVDN